MGPTSGGRHEAHLAKVRPRPRPREHRREVLRPIGRERGVVTEEVIDLGAMGRGRTSVERLADEQRVEADHRLAPIEERFHQGRRLPVRPDQPRLAPAREDDRRAAVRGPRREPDDRHAIPSGNPGHGRMGDRHAVARELADLGRRQVERRRLGEADADLQRLAEQRPLGLPPGGHRRRCKADRASGPPCRPARPPAASRRLEARRLGVVLVEGPERLGLLGRHIAFVGRPRHADEPLRQEGIDGVPARLVVIVLEFELVGREAVGRADEGVDPRQRRILDGHRLVGPVVGADELHRPRRRPGGDLDVIRADPQARVQFSADAPALHLVRDHDHRRGDLDPRVERGEQERLRPAAGLARDPDPRRVDVRQRQGPVEGAGAVPGLERDEAQAPSAEAVVEEGVSERLAVVVADHVVHEDDAPEPLRQPDAARLDVGLDAADLPVPVRAEDQRQPAGLALRSVEVAAEGEARERLQDDLLDRVAVAVELAEDARVQLGPRPHRPEAHRHAELRPDVLGAVEPGLAGRRDLEVRPLLVGVREVDRRVGGDGGERVDLASIRSSVGTRSALASDVKARRPGAGSGLGAAVPLPRGGRPVAWRPPATAATWGRS